MPGVLGFLNRPQPSDGDALQPVYSHAALAVARLPSQFQNSPNLKKLVAILANRFQGPEDALWQIREQRKLSNAIGQQLDNIGQIVGLPRTGAPDTLYRLLLAVQIVLNRSKGAPADILKPFGLVFPAGTVIRFIPEYPAAFRLYVGGTLPDGFTSAIGERIVETAKAAGVRCVFQWDNAPIAEILVADVPALDDNNQVSGPSHAAGATNLDAPALDGNEQVSGPADTAGAGSADGMLASSGAP